MSGRFERSLAEARVRAETDPAGASLALRAGLAMWRGHAYEEFAYESWAQSEISRLEELRLEAIENRIDADLRLGLSRELVSELQSLVRQQPLRERLVMSLMLALYRCGRVAEALRACASYRQLLVVEAGVEPSRAVRDLEQDILVDDGRLLLPRDTDVGPLRPRSGLTVRGYELREEIGRGVFGAVFRAYQPIVGREVAIKVIKPGLADDPAFIRRFEAEAQLVAGLEHPHIVPLYDYWREPGAAYLVMRLLDAGSLADVLAGGALPADRAATVFGQIASALRSAHRSGVVHGDVKPENILIDGDGFAYLADFGVAAGADEYASSPTVPYASPEQLAGRALSPASDQYSLAVVAAAALTGMGGEYEQVRGALAPGARAVLDRATATDPARRYADVATFGQALRQPSASPVRRCSTTPRSRTPTRGCERSVPPMRGSSSGGNVSSNGSSPASAHPAPGAGSWPLSGRAGVVSRAQCEPGCCRRWRRARCRCRRTGSGSTWPRRRIRSRSSRRRCFESRRTHRTRCSTWCSPRAVCAAPSIASCPPTTTSCCWSSTSSRSCSLRSTTTLRPGSSMSSSNSSPPLVRGSVSSSRCAPISMTGRCGIGRSASCCATAPR